jgi:hypothetical protein
METAEERTVRHKTAQIDFLILRFNVTPSIFIDFPPFVPLKNRQKKCQNNCGLKIRFALAAGCRLS